MLGFAIAAGLLVTTSTLGFGSLALWSTILTGLFNSIMFPSIFTLGIAGLGPPTGKGSGLPIAAIVGGASPCCRAPWPDRIGSQHAFVLPVVCYVFIAYCGFRGSRVGTTSGVGCRGVRIRLLRNRG